MPLDLTVGGGGGRGRCWTLLCLTLWLSFRACVLSALSAEWWTLYWFMVKRTLSF